VWTIPRRLFFYSRSTPVSTTQETQIKTETTAKQDNSALPSKKRTRKSIVALSVLALAINGTAAVLTLPSVAIDLPDFGGMVAEMLPHERAPAPIPEAVVAALKDIQSAQQQHAAALQENGSLLQQKLQQNAALLTQDSTTLASLRSSITDEQVDVKKISVQLSTLIAKVDTLQNTLSPEFTSSIPKGRAHVRLSKAFKRTAQQKPVGPVSVGGAPLTMAPVQAWSPSQRPEG
jgi:uncharacterized coiled-coil protein SlyX